MHQMIFQRVCAWSGVVCPAFFFVAFLFAGFIPLLGPDLSAAAVAHHYQTHVTGIRAGSVFMLMSGMFYAAFTSLISAQMQRIPGIHISAVYTQMIAGAFACLTFLVPALLFMVAAFRPERAPETTLMLNDLCWIFLVAPWPPFATQNWSFAYAILTDTGERPVFPRWLGYLNIWAPFIFAPGVLLPFFKSGPFAWDGIFVFWIPATVFGVQFACNTSALLAAIRHEAASLTSNASHRTSQSGRASLAGT